jgi:long-chain acyl-CoA synthetase
LAESIKLVEGELKKYQTGGEFENIFPQRWLPAAAGIVTEPFSEENGLINSTLKMVRTKVVERHTELLDYIYTSEGKQIANNKNMEAFRMLISG